jgi:hypothetical protein
MGLRQMLPVQTNRTVFIQNSMGLKLVVVTQNVNGEIDSASSQTKITEQLPLG